MGLRWPLLIFLLQAAVWEGLQFAEIRNRRETSSSLENKQILTDSYAKQASSLPADKSYHPPLLAAPPAPHVPLYAGYQPPLNLAQSNDYKPLISSSQTQSVRYQPPNSPAPVQGLPFAYSYSQSSGQSPHGYSAPLLASPQTGSVSVNSLPVQQGNRHGLAYAGDHSGLNQFSQHPPSRSHGIEPQSVSAAASSNNDAKNNDEYVVYYYYYYDNDTSANGSSNFDDIPSLESYDTDKSKKEPEKSSSSRTLAADINSLSVNGQDNKRSQDSGLSSQPRSASSGNSNQPPFIRSDKPQNVNDDTAVQPLKPVSNVFRYGSNEVPRFPILPNFVVSEATSANKPGHNLVPDQHSGENPTTQPSGNAIVGSSQSLPGAANIENQNDDENTVLDKATDSKTEDDKGSSDEHVTTTTEQSTTTEEPTTTTDKSRRRPGAGNRRRFNPSPVFSSSRRQPPARSTTSTTTTTTVPPGGVSTRGSFRGPSRSTRPRPAITNNRPRPSFTRSTSAPSDNEDSTKPAELPSSTSTTARPRFGGSSPGSRRFSSTRTRTQPTKTTKSTTTTTSTPPRARQAARPRPNIIPRNRARPGFLRPKAELEEPETTTVAAETATEEESSPSAANESSSPEENETSDESEEEESSETETEEPTTTEKSRFSALFRPRNRSPLNRPRPPISNRS